MSSSRQDATVWSRLAAAIPPNAIQWRADGKPTTRDGQSVVRQVAYIEAGTVRERLDAVVAGEWDLTLEPLPPIDDDGERVYAFKARVQVLGVIREDIGMGRDYKAASTDAFKRAAVRFGVAHELYDMPCKWVPTNGGAAAASRAPVRAPAPPAPAAVDSNGDADVRCPRCGGQTFDNRFSKRNPRAPDYRCRDRSCDGVVWPQKQPSGAIADDGAAPIGASGLPF